MDYREFEALDKYTLTINEIIDEANGTKTIRFDKPEEIDWSEAAHAHFAHLDFALGGEIEEELVRHMSVNGLTEEGYIGFTTRVPGSGSLFKRRLQGLSVGDQMKAYKFESRIRLRRENRNIVLLSMGVGISTMRPLIYAYINESSGIGTLTNINIDASRDYIYMKELEGLQFSGFFNRYVDSRVNLYQLINNTFKSDNIYYIVGHDKFIIELANYLINNGVLAQDIMLDKKEKHRPKYIKKTMNEQGE